MEALADVPADVMRRAIEAQTCPWCGSGPHKRLAAHTQTAHRILARDLRRMAGLPAKASICSSDDSEASRTHLESLPDREAITRKGGERSREVGAGRIGGRIRGDRTLAENRAKHDEIERLFRAGHLVMDIAATVQMHRDAVVNVLRRRGVAKGPLRTERWTNAAYVARFSEAQRNRRRG